MNNPPIQSQHPRSVATGNETFDREAQSLRRTKVFVDLLQQTDQTLLVSLRLPLDSNYVAEANAVDYFGLENTEVYFDVKYSLEMNFEARRKELDEEVKKIYGDKDNEILGKDKLEMVEPRQLKQLMAPLATLGANTFFSLFLADDSTLLRPLEAHGKIVRDAIRSVLARRQLITINTQVPAGTKSLPLFPWAFLYDDVDFDDSNQVTLDPQRFWGFKHVIQEELNCTATLLKLPTSPSILSAICSDADKPQWHSKQKHALTSRNGNITEAPTVAELGNALANCEADCFYFFGHAYNTDPPSQTKSSLQLRGEHLTVDDLKRHYRGAPRFTKNPVLAFLNGCRTAPLNVWNNQSMAGYLCEKEHQKVCCVSTVASVPGSVAAMFGCHFWKLFLTRKLPLGDALLKTRRFMLRKWNNPLGLLYTVFGSVDTRVQR
jgi:hypothetical protein